MKELLFSVYSNPPPVRRGQGGVVFSYWQTFKLMSI